MENKIKTGSRVVITDKAHTLFGKVVIVKYLVVEYIYHDINPLYYSVDLEAIEPEPVEKFNNLLDQYYGND